MRVLDAIERHGSFTAAGKELRRATSALSYAVRSLEDSLQLTLFDRAQHRATLTREGRLLVDEARKVLERSAEFEQTAARLRDGWEPRLAFVVDGLVPLGPVMAAVQSFVGMQIVTRLEVAVASYREVRKRFERDGADLMLTLDEEDDGNERSLPLPPMELLLVAGVDHPLVQEQRRISRSELEEYIEIAASDPAALGDLSPSQFSFSDLRAQRQAVLQGVGFGWLPRHLINDELRDRRLVIVPFEEGFRVRRIPRIVHRRATPPGPAATRFIETLQDEIQQLVRGPRRRAGR
ncbi:MAG: LysR family transcriptional regulator [Myxococcota bacterium]